MLESLAVRQPKPELALTVETRRNEASCGGVSSPLHSYEKQRGMSTGVDASVLTGVTSPKENNMADAPSTVTLSRRRSGIVNGQRKVPRQEDAPAESSGVTHNERELCSREKSSMGRGCSVVVQRASIGKKDPIRCQSKSSERVSNPFTLQNSVSGSGIGKPTALSSRPSPFSSFCRVAGDIRQVSHVSPGLLRIGNDNSSKSSSRRRSHRMNNIDVEQSGSSGRNVTNSSPSSLHCFAQFAAASNGSSLATEVAPHLPLSPSGAGDLQRPKLNLGQLSTMSKTSTGRQMRVRKKVINLSLCKYPLLRIVAAEHDFKVEEEEEDLEKNRFNIIWSDTVLPLTRLVRLANWQRTNHFPSMYLICRKGHLGITLGRIRKLLPASFMFYPRTWSLRSERHQFTRYMMSLRVKKNFKFFILKPNSGCQGRGIVISRDPMNAVEDLDNYVVQEYITKPLLLEGRKFDLRVYVLLTSIREPSIFIFTEGLVRLCSEMYEKPTDGNTRNICKHLTNYAINKHNPDFVFNDSSSNGNVGNKRNFAFFNEWIKSSGMSPEDFWDGVAHVICKTILVAQPQIANVYNTCFPRHNDGFNCFEVLGFDILVGHNMKPWLMEVNHTPSFGTDTPLDYEIKHALVTEVLDILDVKSTDRNREEKRERDDFLHRMIRQPVTLATSIGNRNSTTSETVRSPPPSVSSLLQQHSLPSTAAAAAAAAGTKDTATVSVSLVEEHRAREDSKLRNFRRIYPSTNAEHQSMYDLILSKARSLCSSLFSNPMASPTPLSPQTAEDRQRRFENNMLSGLSSVVTLAANGSGDGSAAMGTESDSLPQGARCASNFLRSNQTQKLDVEIVLQDRLKARVTPRISPATTGENSRMFAKRRAVSTRVLSRMSCIKESENVATPKREPSVVQNSSLTEHTINNAGPENSDVGLTGSVPPPVIQSPSVVCTSHSPNRIEVLRNLQEQLDHYAECEHSRIEDSEVDQSLQLDE